MFNRIKNKFHAVPAVPKAQGTYQPLKSSPSADKKRETAALNQRLQGAAHQSLNFDEIDVPAGNAEVVNAPGLIIQGKIIKDLRRELALFNDLLEKKTSELETITADPSQPVPLALKADIELCIHKIRDLEYQLQEMKLLAARIGAGVGESALILSSKLHHYLHESSTAFAPAIMIGSVAVPFTEALHLFKQKNRYKELGRELKQLKMLHSHATGAKKIELEKKIEEITNLRKRSANSLVEGMAKTATSLVNSSNDALHALSSVAPELISETLLTGASAASALTGIVSAGVNLNELAKRSDELAAIDLEIAKVEKKLLRTTTPLKEILSMRLKSLHFQQTNSVVSATKSGIAITSGVAGTTAGVLGVTSLATAGAIGVTIATAGVAAVVLGGLAAGLGVSNLLYTNRHVIKNKGIYLQNEIDRKILKQQLQKTVQKVEKRAVEWSSLHATKKHAEESQMIFEALLPFEDEVHILEQTSAHFKNLKKNLVFIQQEVDKSRSPELFNSLTAEIENLTTLIANNKGERKQLKEKLHSLIQIINAEANQFKDSKHTLSSKIESTEAAMTTLMAKGDEIEKKVKYAKLKRATIKEAKTVSILRDRLQGTSEKEIETFLVELKELLQKENDRKSIQEFLKKQSIPVIGDDLYQGVMDYLLKKIVV
jgi:hypothetical protein